MMKNRTNEMIGLYKREDALLRVLNVNEDDGKLLIVWSNCRALPRWEDKSIMSGIPVEFCLLVAPGTS